MSGRRSLRLVRSESKLTKSKNTLTSMRKRGFTAMAAATVATVTAALCSQHCAHAFHMHSFKKNARMPLHLDNLDTTRIENDSRLTSTSLIMAVTDPETLLAHKIHQKNKSGSNSLLLPVGSTQRKRSGKDAAILRQDLVMLESSFGLDSSTIKRQIRKVDKLKVPKKKRARRKVVKNTTRIRVTKDVSARRKSAVKKSVSKKNPTISASNRKARKVSTNLKEGEQKKIKYSTRIKVEKGLSTKRHYSVKKKVAKKKLTTNSTTDSKTAKATINSSRKTVVSNKPASRRKVNKIGKKANPKTRKTLKAVSTSSRNTRPTNIVKSQTKKSTSIATGVFQETSKSPTRSKSSTMPGFMDRKNSRRHKSFRDGLKIAQNSNLRRNRAGAAAEIGRYLKSAEETKKRTKANSEAMYHSSATVPDSLIAFANEFHQESRITPKEESELGTKTQEAIHLQKIHDELEEKLGRNPSDNEWCAAAGKINIEALNLAIEEGMEAKDRLVTSNLRMVQGVVNLYIRNGLGSQYNAGDLMQDGTIALIRAAEKFEPKRGFRFSTYAMYWIRAAVKRSQILQSRIINVPQRHHETHKKIVKVESELKKELGRQPNKKELADCVGMTEVQLDRCRTAIAQQCFSLDAELENKLNPNKADTNKDTMHNILAAQYDNAEYSHLKSDFMKEDLVSTLKRYLTPNEVNLLLLRYGLMDERTLPYGFSGPLTIAEVSRLVDLKPDKVRRMINKSLRQLRHLIAHEWEDFESHLQKDLRNQI